MYSAYNRSIPSPFENTLYCGTIHSGQHPFSQKQMSFLHQNTCLMAIILLCLLDCSGS